MENKIYHINNKGEIKICKAKVRQCKFEFHSTNYEDALKYADVNNNLDILLKNRDRDSKLYSELINSNSIIAVTNGKYTTFKYANMGVDFNDYNNRISRGLTL